MKRLYTFLITMLIAWQGFAQCVTVNSASITGLTQSGSNCTFTFTPTVSVVSSGAAAKIITFTFTSGATTVTACYTGNAASTAIVLMSDCDGTRNSLPIGGPFTLPAATITLPCGASGVMFAQTSNNGSGGVCAGPTALNLNTYPVTLTNFSAEVNNQTAYLQWATAEELNNKGFEVQKSINAQDFQAIGFVEGAGTLQARKEYSFRDYDFVTTSYYRLKQVDVDGTSSFSRVISLIPTDESLEVVTLSPNPTQQKVAITLPRNVTSMRIFNSQGIAIKEAKYDENTIQTEADVSGLSAGTYFVEFKTILEKSTKRLIINP